MCIVCGGQLRIAKNRYAFHASPPDEAATTLHLATATDLHLAASSLHRIGDDLQYLKPESWVLVWK